MKPKFPQCSKCTTRVCHPHGPAESTSVDIETAPAFCPMKLDADVLDRAWQEYEKDEVIEMARMASIQEAECFPVVLTLSAQLPQMQTTKLQK